MSSHARGSQAALTLLLPSLVESQQPPAAYGVALDVQDLPDPFQKSPGAQAHEGDDAVPFKGTDLCSASKSLQCAYKAGRHALVFSDQLGWV